MSILARTTFLRTLSRSKKMKVRNHENVVIKKEGMSDTRNPRAVKKQSIELETLFPIIFKMTLL